MSPPTHIRITLTTSRAWRMAIATMRFLLASSGFWCGVFVGSCLSLFLHLL